MAEWLGGLMADLPTWVIGALLVLIFIISVAITYYRLNIEGYSQMPFWRNNRGKK